jgi:hypothetical protein
VTFWGNEPTAVRMIAEPIEVDPIEVYARI